MSAPAVIATGGLTLVRQVIGPAGGPGGLGGHRIELRDGERMLIAFESIEGVADLADQADAANENWPASPPVQEWHDEPRGGATVLMSVGRAGRSHWSLSCEVTPAGEAKFDVAARVNEAPLRLGSRYKILPGKPLQVSAAGMQLPGGWELRIEPGVTRLRYDSALGILSLEPAPTLTGAWPQTVRWGYAFTRSSAT